MSDAHDQHDPDARDLPEALEGEELETEPGPDELPSDSHVQAERPPDEMGRNAD